MKTCNAMFLVLAAAGAVTIGSAVHAKGGEDKPVVVEIDEAANTVKIDSANNDVDVGSLPAVKIDGSQNDVDANVTNEVEIKNATGAAIAVDTGIAPRMPFAVRHVEAEFDSIILYSFEVPAGQLLVIEAVSAGLRSNGDGPSAFEMTLTTGGTSHEVAFGVHAQPGMDDSYANYSVNQAGRWYADPGTLVSLIAAAGSPENMIGEFSLSGYLVPMDEPSLAP